MLNPRELNLNVIREEGVLTGAVEELRQKVAACENLTKLSHDVLLAKLSSEVSQSAARLVRVFGECLSEIKATLSNVQREAERTRCVVVEGTASTNGINKRLSKLEATLASMQTDNSLRTPPKMIGKPASHFDHISLAHPPDALQLSGQVSDELSHAHANEVQYKLPSSLREEIDRHLEDRFESFKQTLDSVPRVQEVVDPTIDPAPEKCTSEVSQLSELETHDYTLTSSVWDLSCFIGRHEVGLGGSIMIVMLYALNLGIQVAFCIFCEQYFTGNDFSTEAINGLDDFRLSSAHSFRFNDRMFDRTLIQQICDEDAVYAQNLMVYAGRQLEVRNTVEDYLKDDANGFLSMFSGKTMCVLAMACWCLSVQGVLKRSWRCLGVVVQIPRGPHTVIKFKELTRLGIGRLWFIVAIKIQEIAIAMFLLIYGCIWLSYTSQVTDLLLNAAALEFVMSVDERIFDALAPRKATTFIESMQPLLVAKKSLCRFGIDSFAILSGLFLVVVVSIFYNYFVRPLVDQMRAAERALCAYERGFTYAFDVHDILWIRRTPTSDATKERIQSAAQQSLRNFIHNRPTPNKALTIDVPNGPIKVLANIASVGLSAYPDSVNPTCVDRILNQTRLHTYSLKEQSLSQAYLYYLRLYTNNHSIRSCDEFQRIGGCSTVDHPGIAICSETCKCASPTSEVFSHDPVHGCPSACLQSVSYKTRLAQLRPSCTDFTLGELQNSSFWNGWGNQVVQYNNISGVRAGRAMLQAHGCAFLQNLPPAWRSDFCFGFDTATYLRPLSPICPQTCQCTTSNNPYCAPACTVTSTRLRTTTTK